MSSIEEAHRIISEMELVYKKALADRQAKLSGSCGTLTGQREKEKMLDSSKVVKQLAERFGFTIDHESNIVETRPGKHPWGADSLTPENFAQLRRDVDDLQEIAMGIANHFALTVTVEDGRKVSVEGPKDAREVQGDPSTEDSF